MAAPSRTGQAEARRGSPVSAAISTPVVAVIPIRIGLTAAARALAGGEEEAEPEGEKRETHDEDPVAEQSARRLISFPPGASPTKAG